MQAFDRPSHGARCAVLTPLLHAADDDHAVPLAAPYVVKTEVLTPLLLLPLSLLLQAHARAYQTLWLLPR